MPDRAVLRARILTGLAGSLVLLVLLAPADLHSWGPTAFLRVPLDGLLLFGLVLLLPLRAKRYTAWTAGVLLGLLTVLKAISLGFSVVLGRPFHPVFDWSFLGSGVDFLWMSNGRAGAIGAIIVAVLIAVAIVVLVALSFVRVSGLVTKHPAVPRTTALITVAGLLVGLPATSDIGDGVSQVHAGVIDQSIFAAEVVIDGFADTPGQEMLNALRGKDVIFAFVESYGRSALTDPQVAPNVPAVLDAGAARLTAAGFSARSGVLTSPTVGGGSWLAQSTLLSGLWIDNPQRYSDLVASDRLTLSSAFRDAGWRTVAVMAANTSPWPEGDFYGYDRIYAAAGLGYHGPQYSFATMPDQYTLSAFHRFERAAGGHSPVMAVIPLISSHAPWRPVPPVVDWDQLGDGAGFAVADGSEDPAEAVFTRDRVEVRADYGRAVGYSLECLISYVATYGGDDLVLVMLGDHQPSPLVTGNGAGRDVPITIVAHDPAVIERIDSWGWHDGLQPGPDTPIWRMDTFRDRFLTAFE